MFSVAFASVAVRAAAAVDASSLESWEAALAGDDLAACAAEVSVYFCSSELILACCLDLKVGS